MPRKKPEDLVAKEELLFKNLESQTQKLLFQQVKKV